MEDKLWTDNFKILLQRNRLLEFWPNAQMHLNERVNASSRFLLYAGVLISLQRRKVVFAMLSLVLIILLGIITKAKKVPSRSSGLQPAHAAPKTNKMTSKTCQLPTKDNPLANYMMTDDVNRPSACPSDEVNEQINEAYFAQFERDPTDFFNKKHSQRQFFSNPNTKSMNDQEGYAKWLYGGPNKKSCKENPSVCTGFEVGPGAGGK